MANNQGKLLCSKHRVDYQGKWKAYQSRYAFFYALLQQRKQRINNPYVQRERKEKEMKIYTMIQSNLYQITKMDMPIYVESIPYSLQMKCNIPKRVVINCYKGNQNIFCGTRRVISGQEAQKIIKVLNGYSKVNNQVVFR